MVDVHTLLEGARAAEMFAQASRALQKDNPIQASELALAAATVSAATLRQSGALRPLDGAVDRAMLNRAIESGKAEAWRYARGPADFSISGVARASAVAALTQILTDLGIEPR